MRAWLDQVRYEHPRIWVGTLSLASLLMIGAVAKTLVTPEVSRLLGFDTLVEKTYLARDAIYWSWRAFPEQPETQPYQQVWGYIDRIVVTPTGKVKLLAMLVEGNQYVPHTLTLANVVPKAQPLQASVQHVRQRDALFDIFKHPDGEQVIVWIDRQPWNIEVIKAGAGSPDPAPPTRIADRVFATYYWHRLINQID
ncbi:hypothetical protein [Marinobacterium stanieri]|uniref:Uncharacterized protein n=1 Tax=Marinobacterium stanieri TaxID=49186 RepID=A0A1N6XGU3_9GAMM|nr:hypothetical protein [Marinobacterium stanieri]SIR01582.1 hypothetical protein SAMN05421647_11422 [Marinobacterium stanieri]